MSQIFNRIHVGVKSSSNSILTVLFRVFSGLIVGVTFALIGQQLISYEDFSFVFVVVMTTLLFMRMTRGWGFVATIIFDLICVLLGLVLRMYILVAPGA